MEAMKFAGRWIELEKQVILSKVTQKKKDMCGMNSLICIY